MSEEITTKSKSAAKSKLNLVGLAMVLLGAVTDPAFAPMFGQFIPEEWLGRILFLAGWGVIGLRTFGTNSKIELNWRKPWGGDHG